MIGITKEEKHLKSFMIISAVTYFVVGFAFAIVPVKILKAFNFVSRFLNLGFEEVPLSVEKFWLSLAFSMMMTITVLCIAVNWNVRKYKAFIIPLLVSKAASALSSIWFFIFSAKYLAYLGIFLVDGSIFWITLFFYIRANKAFFEAQTFYLRKKLVVPKSTGPTTVVVLEGDDKFDLLNRVLNDSCFDEVLEDRFKESGNSK